MTTKTPSQVATEIMQTLSDNPYDWDLHSIIAQGIKADRKQLRAVLKSHDAVTDIRPFPIPSTSSLVDAWDAFDGDDVGVFTFAWDRYLLGTDFPCPEHPAGLHSTEFIDDGSCDYCGDKNRG